MKKFSPFILSFILFLLFPVHALADFPNWTPITFTASNVTLDPSTNSTTFNLNPSDFSGFPTTNIDVRLTNVAFDSGWYANNADVTTCLTTGNCSFPNLQQYLFPPGETSIGGEYQIGFFPADNGSLIRWSQVISVPLPPHNWTPITFTASNVTLDPSTNSVTFNINPADFSGFPTTNIDVRVTNSEFDSGWYTNNADVTTCLTTGSCSFPNLQQYLIPPGDPRAGGTYQIGFFIDGNGGSFRWSQVLFANQTPSVGTITVFTNPVQVNTATAASASFTDPDTADTHTASWNWGDGNTTTGTVTESNGSGSISDSHTYSTAGVYTVTLTLTDNHGASGQSTFQYVSVYNPTSQGLFTAGQHFSSPAGAYPQNSSLTGTVKFGLSYKYQGTMPVGDKQFTMNFSAANLLFNATSISSLVTSNGTATLRGTGTINGSGTYNFLVVGVDGGGIRIKITDPNNNTVIYDTQLNAADTATPSTSVTGHVVVHG